jgi:hypothetical protein
MYTTIPSHRLKVAPVTVFVVLIIGCGIATSAEPAAKTPMTATQVTTFRPAKPGGRPRSGHCWTESIAVNRPDAWRCMVGNFIYDPCFEISTAPAPVVVVCGAEPDGSKKGFVLKLTKPLPKRAKPEASAPSPWRLELEDGAICSRLTGTVPFVNEQALPYACSLPSEKEAESAESNVWLGASEDINRSDAVWKVNEVRFESSRDGLRVLESKTVAIRRAWQ